MIQNLIETQGKKKINILAKISLTLIISSLCLLQFANLYFYSYNLSSFWEKFFKIFYRINNWFKKSDVEYFTLSNCMFLVGMFFAIANWVLTAMAKNKEGEAFSILMVIIAWLFSDPIYILYDGRYYLLYSVAGLLILSVVFFIRVIAKNGSQERNYASEEISGFEESYEDSEEIGY